MTAVTAVSVLYAWSHFIITDFTFAACCFFFHTFIYNLSVNVSTSNIDAQEAIEQLITYKEEIFECRNCGKTTTRIGDLRKHVEIHIDGLSYKCTACGNTFRSRMILSNHRRTCDV